MTANTKAYNRRVSTSPRNQKTKEVGAEGIRERRAEKSEGSKGASCLPGPQQNTELRV